MYDAGVGRWTARDPIARSLHYSEYWIESETLGVVSSQLSGSYKRAVELLYQQAGKGDRLKALSTVLTQLDLGNPLLESQNDKIQRAIDGRGEVLSPDESNLYLYVNDRPAHFADPNGKSIARAACYACIGASSASIGICGIMTGDLPGCFRDFFTEHPEIYLPCACACAAAGAGL
jgi:hypothetical protein